MILDYQKTYGFKSTYWEWDPVKGQMTNGTPANRPRGQNKPHLHKKCDYIM
jgi:hypothetical protein